MPSASRGSRGFTLIEVLVALAILALVTGFAFRAFSGALSWVERGEHEQAALLLAQTLLDRVGRDLPLQDGERSGRTPDGMIWQVRLSPDTASVDPRVSDPVARGLVVDVTVGWTEPYAARRLHLSTLRLVPVGGG
jgi:general secretion pathway protein I